MGQNIATLQGCVANIQNICVSLRSLVSADLYTQGVTIVVKIKEFVRAFPWFYSVPLSVGAFIYFLPGLLNMMADWIRALRAAWNNLKSAWRGNSKADSSGSDASAKAAKLEKKIEALEAENKKLQRLLETNQDYAMKNNISPVDIFVPRRTVYQTRT